MNSIISIDKLIICYQVTTFHIRLTESYFKKHYQFKDSTWNLGNGCTCYKNESENEKEIPCGFRIALELNEVKIGTLFLDGPSKDRFYFKFEKHIFYTNTYSIHDIKELIDNLFTTFRYNYSGITKIEIACDTNQSKVDLFVIADLCQANPYFRSIKSIEHNPDDLKIIQKFGGRKYTKAKYGVTVPKLRIYHHTKFPLTTCIGNYNSDIFLKCYEKSKKWETYQKEYFEQNLPNSERIFRLEVSLNSKAISRFDIQFDQLGDDKYLKSVYFATAKQRLTFNRFRISRKTKKQVKNKNPICILDNLKFGEMSATASQSVVCKNQTITFEPRKRLINHGDSVNNFKGQVAKLIGTFLQGKNQTATFQKIKKIIEEESLIYQFTNPNLESNILEALELVNKRLEKGKFLNGITMANRLKPLIQNISMQIMAKESIETVEEVITVKSKRDKYSKRKMGISLEIRRRID